MRYAVIQENSGMVVSMIADTEAYYDGASVFEQLYIDVTDSKMTDEEYFKRYYKDGEFKLLSVSPSRYHKWELSLESWVAPENYIEKAKEEYISEINKSAFSKIAKVYPIYKQINIGRFPASSEAVTMFTFIDDIRGRFNATESDIKSATTLEEIKSLIDDFQNFSV